MKVAIILPNSKIADMQYYNSQEIGLARVASQYGIRFDIFYFSKHRGMQCRITRHNEIADVNLIAFDGIGLIGKQAVSLSLLSYIWTHRKEYSAIQVHDSTQLLSVLAAILSKRLGIPSILYQGMYRDFVGLKGSIQWFFELLTSRMFYSSVHTIVAKTQSARKYIACKSKRPVSQIMVINVGIDKSAFLGADHISYNRDIDILYVGKLEPRRNTKFLGRLLNELCIARSDIQITIIGSGPDKVSFLASISRYLANGQITYIERVDNTSIHNFYARAKVYTAPTQYEIFGMSILEAMCFGAITIASNEAGPAEIITDGVDGFIMNNFQIQDWQQKVFLIMDNHGMRNRMRECAVEKIDSRFSWKVKGIEFAGLYKAIASNPVSSVT